MRQHIISIVAILVLANLELTRAWTAGIPLATDAPKPLPPEQSQKEFQVAPGFRIELVAAEPLVTDPVAIDFDARSRIFVCEIHGYNLEGYLDVLELNKTGILDKGVRRIPANPEAIKKAAEQQYGTVKLLEDTDGDGRMDRATVWADRLPPCYGVVAARDGVIVLAAPDIYYLADRDGDGKPEVRERLFTGFGLYDLWSRINNPRWGVDNWIYAANGINSGGTIRGPRLPEPVRIPATSFRFKPDGSALEPTSGSSSGFGLAIDDWGDRFMVSNQQHVLYVLPLEHRYLARNPYYAAPATLQNICSYGHPARVYPISQPDPWRLQRSKDPAWVQFYGVAEATANGFFTAASGQTIYQGHQFPKEFWANHFSVDNAQNLVHRCLLIPEGAGYIARRPVANEQTEFLRSREQWFRPVNLMTGPEGALYVVDMYRAIIEDYSAIPRYLQQIYIDSLIAGADRGRIWRVQASAPGTPASPQQTPPGQNRAYPWVDLTRLSAAELVADLDHPNAWRRKTAQRLLVERQDRGIAPALADLVKNGKTPQGRLHALYALQGLGLLEPEVVVNALADPHWALRVHGLMVSERWLDRHAGLRQKALALCEDPVPRVRLQAALSLGESRSADAVAALSRLAARYGDDPWMQSAVLSSSAETAQTLAAEILRGGADTPASQAMVRPLAAIVAARQKTTDLAKVLAAVADHPSAPAVLRRACLEGLCEGLKRTKVQTLAPAHIQPALVRLLADPDPQVAEAAFIIAGLLRLHESPQMQSALAGAERIALDGDRPVSQRVAAIALVASSPFDRLARLAPQLLDARQPLDVQLAAVRALGRAEDPRTAAVLLTPWPSYTPQLQAAVLDAVFQRQDRLPHLLDAMEKKIVMASALDPLRRTHLLENPNAAIRKRAGALLAGITRQDRREVLARYAAALQGPRDPKRGQAVFEQQCAKCHQVQGKGFAVGPDLSSVTRRSDEMLLSDILDPSNQITTGYNQYTVITEDGRIFTGVLAAESATSVTLRKEQATDEIILRKDIEVMAASTNSMMPENLEKEVSPQDVADLIAWLRQAFGPAGPNSLTLFDDEQAFVALLAEGEGKAALETADRLTGTAALRIAPPQRYCTKVPGWQYRIAEKPGPGEYRYLRFAWKSKGAAGVMLEFAADGQWPPADKPLRRYYAGQNTTGWAALQLSPQAPAEWTVVTCDLWKDFGAFTLTGIAPTAMGGEALFDRIELLSSLDAAPSR